MVVESIKYGVTRWDLLKEGSRYYLQITVRGERYLYPLQYDARHQRLHPSSEDLMTMDPMDLKAINMMARAHLGEHPRSNPAGVKGRTPLLLKRRVSSILKSMMKNRSGVPSREEVSKAFAFATSQLQRQKYMKAGARELTKVGKAKEASMEDWKRAEADQIFSAWVEGRGVKTAKPKPAKVKSAAKPKPAKVKSAKAKPTKSKTNASKPAKAKPTKSKTNASKPAKAKPTKSKTNASKPAKAKAVKGRHRKMIVEFFA